jgi:hypothetical protein
MANATERPTAADAINIYSQFVEAWKIQEMRTKPLQNHQCKYVTMVSLIRKLKPDSYLLLGLTAAILHRAKIQKLNRHVP